MNNIISIPDKQSWFLASLSKQELAWAEKNNIDGLLDDRIRREKDFIRSFKMGSQAA